MSKMTFTSPRATYEETLAFANAIREAGGGNPLDALMPAVPADASQCLIAKNLNFNCTVGGLNWLERDDMDETWYMRVVDEQVAHRIAESLELPIAWDGPSTDEQRAALARDLEEAEEEGVVDQVDQGAWAISLPAEIGQVAQDFDAWDVAVTGRRDSTTRSTSYSINALAPEGSLDNLRAFWPYIDASVKETYANATFINERGELIL